MLPARFDVRVVFAAVVVLLCAVSSSAQSTVYFVAQSPAGTYPATCTSGSLSCSTNGTGFACTGGTVAGTHWYYPSATAPTFTSALLTGQPATICEQYAADYQLPLTTAGLNIQYGTSALPVCVNYRVGSNGQLTADPDAVEASPLTFNYSTTASSLATCPAPVAATGSGSATVYFTYLGVNGSGTSICASGSLSCTYYGNNQYYCPTLNGGTHYMYNYSTNAYQTVTLTSEVECNGFGDGYLPLDYEGISFAGAFSSVYNCISWYGSGSGQAYDLYTSGSLNVYKSYGGTRSFTYSTTQTTAVAACQAYIPGLSGSSGAAAHSAHSSLPLLLAAMLLAAVALAM